jgi:AbrB family looped-hinge helix DNA binding protein
MSTYHTVISSKGQVVVPAELREQFGLKKGTRATWTHEKGRLILMPINERVLDELHGFLKLNPGEPSVFEASIEERERERRRERERK